MADFWTQDVWPIVVVIFLAAIAFGIVMWRRRPRDADAVKLDTKKEAVEEMQIHTPPD